MATEKKEKADQQGSLFDDTIGKSAVERGYVNTGRLVEQLRLGLANWQEHSLFVYKIEFRAPSAKSAEWLCLLKVLSPEGAQIGFISGGTWVACLNNVGAKIRSGTLELHEDSFPPDDWSERLAYYHANGTWVMF